MQLAEKLILDRYKILEELGSGGFSTVYKAFDSKMERLVAIKFIPSDSKATTWAKREAKTSAHLNHPNIATIHEYEETDEGHYLIMEYLEGITLRDILDELDQLEIEEAVAITSQVAIALECAHVNFVVHKDIKPENLMILNDGRIKIMDFGTARLISQTEAAKKALVGTPSYMSPELINSEMTDDRTDQFSLAIVLYEMLTGRTPFEASTTNATLYKVANINPQAPSALRKDIPPEMDKSILRALSKNRDERYATVTDFRYKVERSTILPANSRTIVKNLYQRLSAYAPGEEELEVSYRSNLLDVVRDFFGRTYLKNKEPLKKIFSGILLASFTLVLTAKLLPTSYLYFPPLAVLLAAIFQPLAGIALTSLVLIIKSFASSLAAGFLSLALVAAYLSLYSLKWPLDSVFPLAAIILDYLRLGIAYPLLVGLTHRPKKAAVYSAVGALLLSFYVPLNFKASFGSIYLTHILHILLWVAVSSLISMFSLKRELKRDIFVLLVGLLILIIGYLLIPGLKGANLEKVMQSASLSLIISLAILAVTPYDYLETRDEG